MGGIVRGWRYGVAACVLCVAVAAAVALACVFAGSAIPAYAASDLAKADVSLKGSTTGMMSSATAKAKKGWVSTKAGKSYYRNGVRLTGLQAIGKKRYYFNAEGIMRVGVVKAGKTTYYLSDDGVLEGAKVGKRYYYATLKPMTSADTYDFKTFQKAHSIVRSISGKNDSKATKLRKAFNWVIGKSYSIHRNFSPSMTNWPAIYANDHFDSIGGDCHADGAAFAYLAAAIGYDADVCLDSMGSGYAPSHCWTMIGPRVYDPLFAEAKSYSGYYGVTSGTYEVNPVKRYRVPRFNPANAKKGSKQSKAIINSGKVGLRKENGSYYYYNAGMRLKGAWKKVGNHKYYFKANGKAATYSTKIGNAYYIFDEQGRLKTPSEAKRVKVGAHVYRVTKSGKAKPGWAVDKKSRFDKTGKLICGVSYIDGAFYAASAKGAYDADKTAKLKAASQKGKPAAELKALLGNPKQTIYAKSCNIAGDDGLWIYGSFAVMTARLADGTPEYVCSIEAR